MQQNDSERQFKSRSNIEFRLTGALINGSYNSVSWPSTGSCTYELLIIHCDMSPCEFALIKCFVTLETI